MRAQPLDLRSRELRAVRREGQASLTFKSRRIAQGRNESSTIELTKRRIARGDRV
jgi:hypothetical protein